MYNFCHFFSRNPWVWIMIRILLILIRNNSGFFNGACLLRLAKMILCILTPSYFVRLQEF
jgi:hypothetical protein